MRNKLNNLRWWYERRTRLPIGSNVYVRKNEKFPDGTLGKVISYNTFQSEYQITTKVQSELSHSNPYILENEETGFKVLEEEFNNGEFVPYNQVELIDLEPRNVVDYLTSPVALLALGAILFCTGGLLALELVR